MWGIFPRSSHGQKGLGSRLDYGEVCSEIQGLLGTSLFKAHYAEVGLMSCHSIRIPRKPDHKMILRMRDIITTFSLGLGGSAYNNSDCDKSDFDSYSQTGLVVVPLWCKIARTSVIVGFNRVMSDLWGQTRCLHQQMAQMQEQEPVQRSEVWLRHCLQCS